METKLTLKISSRMTVVKWSHHDNGDARLDNLYWLWFLRTRSSCCPVTMSMRQIYSPVQFQRTGCGYLLLLSRTECVLQSIKKDRRTLWLLFSSLNVTGGGGQSGFKGKYSYNQVSFCNMHYIACTGNTVPPVLIWCNHITCHNIFQVSISTLFNFSCFIVFSS